MWIARSIAVLTALVAGTALAQSRLDAGTSAPAGDNATAAIVGADVGVGWNILSIPLFAFQFSSGGGTAPTLEGYFISPGSFFSAHAAVQLPTGALIGQVGLFAYDTEPTSDVQVLVWQYTGYGTVAGCSPCGLPAPPSASIVASVTSSGSPGYQYSRSTLNSPHTVDNYVLRGGGQYGVSVTGVPVSSDTLGFRGVEIWWKRQISPAPTVASFVDVPTTHQFFREIEALKEAGITLGCTATQFCPNASLTRAQMAAFLARALGLYWQY